MSFDNASSNRAVRLLILAVAIACFLLHGPRVSLSAPPEQSQRAEQRRLDPKLRRFDSEGRMLLTPETRKAIDAGLAFLAKQQKDDGSIGSGRFYERNVGVTALAGMAFLAAGHTPGRGKYGREVEKTVDFVLSRCRPSGYIVDEESQSHGPMYGHGFATLFLAEVYGMSRRKDLREKLENAVKLIVKTQNKEGGWRYQPEPKDADVSVTVCQLMALRAARNAGIYVPKSTIDKCTEYVKKCQNRDGSFRYRLHEVSRLRIAFPRSAACVVALYGAGIYDGSEVDSGISYLMRHLPQKNMFRPHGRYFYGHYYAVQAMWIKGGSHWERWYPAIRNELLDPRRMLARGGWSDKSICNEYGTAMACLILQMPNNHLPIFQR